MRCSPAEKGKTMREKLIELIDKAHSIATDAEVFDDASYEQQLEMEADYLIAHGVTIKDEEIDFDYDAEDDNE